MATKDELRALFDQMPPEQKAVHFVTTGVLLLFISLFVPYVSFDAAPPGTDWVWPQGEYLTLADDMLETSLLTLIELAIVVATIGFAYRYSLDRAVWAYRLMWATVLWSSLIPLSTLTAFVPGFTAWSALTPVDAWWGYGEALKDGTLDWWISATNARAIPICLIVSSAGMMVYGALQARKRRKLDRDSLRRHQQSIIESPGE